MDRRSPLDWCLAAILIALIILLAGCAPQSSKPTKTFPIGTVVAFVSEPDVIIGHVAGYDGCNSTWRIKVRIKTTGEVQTVEPNELVVISKPGAERPASRRGR